ncbi:MAG TPA: chemotaxis protein CheB [Polyangiaceae bacterium]|nr:chemotaxis protein CheB [Polyangiaceae bacterium]
MSNDAALLPEGEGPRILSTAPAALPIAPSFVVGIGASAGGLEALERFFVNAPRESGMAYVVVQHLSPDFRSLMDELLARHTQLPIKLVEDGMTVEADHVYLIPPKKEMIISGGRLLLSERDRQQHELSLPIDVFFRSLAQDCGRRAIAVVLSGGGSDGSRGIRAVHDAGGLVVVQDTESAQFDGMPKTARDAGVADWVLSPGEMPGVLVDHARRGGLAVTPRAVDGPGDGFATVYQMLQSEFGIDFTHYKPSTVTRRIERRLKLTRTDHMDGYVERLRRGQGELDLLYRDLLIGVTRFFRNEEAFTILGERVLPEILQRLPKNTPFRAWVAGCATGEEVYSLAILLDELSARFGERTVQIFATDVHRGSLEHAARGMYDEAAVANVSPARLERYFVRRASGYEIVPDLRRMAVFAPHNVIKDPPFTRVDLVSCRNLLIYLQPAAQQKALSLFHFALNRGGVVFLGPSESPGALIHDFEPVDRHWRMYRKYSSSRIDVDARLQPGGIVPRLGMPLAPAAPPRHSISQLLATYDEVLGKYMPPGLLINDRGELVHSFSGASKFLQLRDGRQGLDVLDVVHPELRSILIGPLQRALKDPTALVLKGVHCAPGDETLYNVSIERLAPDSGAVSVLVTFEPAFGTADRKSPHPTEIHLDALSRERVAGLEQELAYTKENLQSAIEELQTSNEELQASNEELLASNEELQSTNEELQSVNEELYTVNAEYQRKIAELTELTNDMDNLLAATGVGTVFLDKQLRIRKFTYPIAKSFNLLPQDVGRSIESFRNDIGYAGVIDDVRHVLATGERVEREIRKDGGTTSFLQLLPYRAKGGIEGVVLTLIDVSGLKAAEDALFHERYLLDSLLFNVPDAIYFKDARGKFIRANGAMARRLGLADPGDAVGKTALEMPDQAAALALHQLDEGVLRSGEPQHYELEEWSHGDGNVEWDLVTRLPLRDRTDGVVGVIGVFRDVTEQKRAEAKIQEAVRRRDQFLAMLSHELRNPLGAVVMATSLLKTDIPDGHRKRLLGILDRQSQQMARLLDDLLEVNRVTENKIELRKEVLDLREVSREAADSVRSLMEARGLAFTSDVEGAPLWVDGDAARLQQIQANLLANAAKYTSDGGSVRLWVGCEGGDAVIRVRDDGAGIARGMLETVFDLFVQAGRTLDRAQGGIGVGLTLVRSLVTMHKGTVVAESDGEGRGSEFVVRLPTVPAPRGAARGRSRDRGLALPRGARVAIIEDNADSREMLCEALTIAGFECKSADNGVAGLALIRSMLPDLAIVDLGLPAMDGFELARRIREDERCSKVQLIAVTGYGQRDDRQRAIEAGFNLHMVKPVEPLRLVAMLSGANAA